MRHGWIDNNIKSHWSIKLKYIYEHIIIFAKGISQKHIDCTKSESFCKRIMNI